ncbi:MAG: hypothetical protein ACI9CE_003860 [Flavobacterium sp.]|jgi:hypothetical protein
MKVHFCLLEKARNGRKAFDAPRTIKEYLDVLDNMAFGAAKER